MRISVTGAFVALSFFVGSFANASDYAKVLEVSGGAEILEEGQWEPLAVPLFLDEDRSIRTRADGSVRVALDRNFESAVELGAGSSLKLQKGSPPSLFAEKGLFYFVNDFETPPSAYPAIDTPHFFIETHQGGYTLGVSETGSWIKVFGGKAVVRGVGLRPTTIDEGFKFSWNDKEETPSLERIGVSEYAVWQKWIRTFYKERDDIAAEVIKKMLSGPN